MKRSIKIAIGSIVGIIIVAGIVFAANGDYLQGRLSRMRRVAPTPTEVTKVRPSYNEKKCYDSDSGKNYEKKGTTYGTMTSDTSKTRFTDYCDGNTLVEYSCERNRVKKNEKECSSCGSGKCESPVSTQAFLENNYINEPIDEEYFSQPIDRAEAFYFISRITNPLFSTTYSSEELTGCYSDINNVFAENVICWGKLNEVFGNSGDYFYPENELTREEAVVLISKAFSGDFGQLQNEIDDITISYNDVSESSAIYIYLKILKYINVLNISGNQFKPDIVISREEFIDMLFKVKLTTIYEQEIFTNGLVNQYKEDKRLCKTPNTVDLSQSAYNEELVFAVNNSYSEENPNWKNEAEELVSMLEETVSTNFEINIAKFLTYPDGVDRYQYAKQHPEFFFDNEFPYSKQGLTVMACVSLDNDMSDCPDGGNQLEEYTQGTTDVFDIIRYTSQDNLLEASSNGFFHEWGHHMGIVTTHPEWYEMTYYHNSQTEFNSSTGFWSLCYTDPYKNDPMCGGMSGNSSYNWSPLSQKIIELNSKGKYSKTAMRDFAANQIELTVKKNGNLVNGANVKIYNYGDDGGNPWKSFQLYRTTTTDENGQLFMQPPFWGKYWTTFLVDVTKGSDRGQTIVNYIDMEEESLLNNSCVLEIDIELN
jgi:hypothetical protein